jgi:hypothetical protein
MMNTEQHPQDLLPWYINGSLSEQEQQEVELHLQQCSECRDEVELLQAMQSVAKQPSESLPSQFAWHRLQRDMRQDTQTSPAKPRRWGLSLAAAAAVAVIAIQGVLLLNISQQDNYQLAGHELEGVVLQVRFNPDATEQAIREALQGIDAEIVTGPGAAGVYRIHVGDHESERDLQNKINQLRQNREVIDYLQRD